MNTTITPELQIKKEIFDIIEITEEQVRQENRSYNASEWDRIINRYSSYKDIKFYVVRPQKGFSYNQYFAKYTIHEGITLLASIGYSSSITNSGFCLVEINNGKLYRKLLKDLNGNYGYCANDRSNRSIMANNCKNLGVMYSNEF